MGLHTKIEIGLAENNGGEQTEGSDRDWDMFGSQIGQSFKGGHIKVEKWADCGEAFMAHAETPF